MTIFEQRAAFAASLRRYDIIINSEKSISYGVQWKVSRKQETATVNTYHGKKGFRLVVQGASPQLQQQIEHAFKEVGQPPNAVNIPFGNTADHEPAHRIIGCDESGKGDVLGPLVVAAVTLRTSESKEVSAWGVCDSKQLTDEKILVLAERFWQSFPEASSVTCLMPNQYNEQYAAYRDKRKNLNHLLTDLHFHNIAVLCERFPTDQVILDRFAPGKMMEEQFSVHGLSVPLLQVPRGEQFIEVAMASVLARAVFVQRMNLLSEIYDRILPKGAGRGVATCIAELVQQYGTEVLGHIGKLHFKTFDSYR